MNRDRSAVCKIISDMLDNPDEVGIYGTGKCFDRLILYIESERAQAIGWAYAEACVTSNEGFLIEETEVSYFLQKAMIDLDLPLENNLAL